MVLWTPGSVTRSAARRPRRLRGDYALQPIGNAVAANTLDQLQASGFGYQQMTAFAQYTLELGTDWNLEYRVSYDIFDFERIRQTTVAPTIAHREDEFYTRLLANWSPNPCHSAAVGIEYYWEKFGLPSPGFPYTPAYTQRLQNNTAPWTTDTISLLGEYRWSPNDYWTFFLGAGRTTIPIPRCCSRPALRSFSRPTTKIRSSAF